ncbi:DNA-binding protein [Paenibacillus chartarius]|uniref:DNA-binding protein n=1 Tax=Paenibacillus chartarius TaxID=747481 RepID=A0ABV6DJ85_9BACL
MKAPRKLLHLGLALALALPSIWTGSSAVHAIGPNDPAPVIEPATPNGKKVLFDNTHGQTAGAADWVIDGGFSDFANAIAQEGYYVKELRKTAPITYDDLKDYDVFVIPEANIPYKTYEQDALLEYTKKGGSIFFIGDHYNADRNLNRWDSAEVFNGYRRGAFGNPTKGMSAEEANSIGMKDVTSTDWLAQNFGLRFRYNSFDNDTYAKTIVKPEQTFGITKNVSTVAMHAGGTLAIVNPKIAKGLLYLPTTGPDLRPWNNAVDQGIYMGGGVAEGPYAAISKLQLGKAAFIGDSSPVEDKTPKYVYETTGGKKTTYDGFKEVDDAKLLINIINWLAKKETYTSFDQIDGLELDEPTPLLAMENPASSTEPQPEPWSTPPSGYKWWDQSTFKPGSYGSSVAPDDTSSGGIAGDFSFIAPTVVNDGEEFTVTVSGLKAAASSSITLEIGVYLPSGGAQIGLVKKDDGTWPTTYGYNKFTVTTDASGNFSKVLTLKTKPGTTGSANIRLRKDGDNVYQTTAVTIN